MILFICCLFLFVVSEELFLLVVDPENQETACILDPSDGEILKEGEKMGTTVNSPAFRQSYSKGCAYYFVGGDERIYEFDCTSLKLKNSHKIHGRDRIIWGLFYDKNDDGLYGITFNESSSENRLLDLSVLTFKEYYVETKTVATLTNLSGDWFINSYCLDTTNNRFVAVGRLTGTKVKEDNTQMFVVDMNTFSVNYTDMGQGVIAFNVQISCLPEQGGETMIYYYHSNFIMKMNARTKETSKVLEFDDTDVIHDNEGIVAPGGNMWYGKFRRRSDEKNLWGACKLKGESKGCESREVSWLGSEFVDPWLEMLWTDF